MTHKKSIVDEIKAAWRVSVPLVAITTSDPAATIELLRDAINGESKKVSWDIVDGLRAIGEAGKEAIAEMSGEPSLMTNPVSVLAAAKKLPKDSILFIHLANRYLVDPSVIQAIWNLRDPFKGLRRMLILLSPAIDLPPEISGDVLVFDEPLPDADALSAIITSIHADANRPLPEAATMTRSIEAVQGLTAFQAEQVVAMSLRRDGLDIPNLWERKRHQIELTPGLKVNREPIRFSEVGGVHTVKNFLNRILGGESRPNAVVFIDEIEKAMAGSSGAGDTSGIAQDQLGTLLSYMQDNSAVGCVFVGPPGSAKSMIAKAAGNEAGIPTIQLDLGATKGSLVGQSEQGIRNALKVITSVSNGRSLWIATCNSINELPIELRRRFTLGTFFFDLPTKEERQAIWKIWLGKYAINATLPSDNDWTGAEIKQCCDIAWRTRMSLKDAAAFVIPISRSAAEQINRLRAASDGKFLSANNPGIYVRETDQSQEKPRRRSINANED